MLVDADTLVRQGLHIPRREARRWAHLPIEQEELEADGNVGLVKAAQRFDARRGTPFAAFALMYVRGAMLETIRKRVRQRSDRNGGFIEVFSLNEPSMVDERLPAHDPVDPRPGLDEQVDQLDRIRLVAGLPDRERYALLRTTVDGATMEEVGDELGIRPSTVYKLTSHGSIRLRRRAA